MRQWQEVITLSIQVEGNGGCFGATGCSERKSFAPNKLIIIIIIIKFIINNDDDNNK